MGIPRRNAHQRESPRTITVRFLRADLPSRNQRRNWQWSRQDGSRGGKFRLSGTFAIPCGAGTVAAKFDALAVKPPVNKPLGSATLAATTAEPPAKQGQLGHSSGRSGACCCGGHFSFEQQVRMGAEIVLSAPPPRKDPSVQQHPGLTIRRVNPAAKSCRRSELTTCGTMANPRGYSKIICCI